MEPTRKFKIIVNSKECGTCSGSSPSAVAKKVVKKLCGNSSKVVKFSLKECKRDCERVCGPYQGRMEKLDKPYTRAGKKITHRVVCEKVKKMRGGLDPNINKYIKNVKLVKKFIKKLFDYCNDSNKNTKAVFYVRYIKGIIQLYWYNIATILISVSDRLQNTFINLYDFKEKIQNLKRDKKSLLEKVYESVVEVKKHSKDSFSAVFNKLKDMAKYSDELKAFIEYLIDKINELMLDDETIESLYQEIRSCLESHKKSRIDCYTEVPPKILFLHIEKEISDELKKNNNNGNNGNRNE